MLAVYDLEVRDVRTMNRLGKVVIEAEDGQRVRKRETSYKKAYVRLLIHEEFDFPVESVFLYNTDQYHYWNLVGQLRQARVPDARRLMKDQTAAYIKSRDKKFKAALA